MLLQLLLSIIALAEPEDITEEDHPSEAMDALLEAGQEEGISRSPTASSSAPSSSSATRSSARS